MVVSSWCCWRLSIAAPRASGGAIEQEISLTTAAMSCIAAPLTCCACAAADSGRDHFFKLAAESATEGDTFLFTQLILVTVDDADSEATDGER